MTDDKVIEAALDALFGGTAWGAFQQDITRERMRAALAAADKVRAEGFDFVTEAHSVNIFAPEWRNSLADSFKAAYAAGLAKGEADRAAIEKTRDEWCAEYTKARDERAALVEALNDWNRGEYDGQGGTHAFAARVNALALVRKGE